MEVNLLDRMLSSYQDAHTAVTVTLQNKIRVTGKIIAFDSYVIVLEGQKREILYRHAVSALAPAGLRESTHALAAVHQPDADKSAKKPPRRDAARPAQRRHQPQSGAAETAEPINSSMKDGLLKWMQEQKAAK